MKWLLDTGVWLRGVNEMATIPRDLLHVMKSPRELFGVSAISLWEIGKKIQIGKLGLPKDLFAWFEDAIASNIQIIPITPEIVSEAMRLPEFPNRDPADELIVATARVHQLTLMTTDTALRRYKHTRIRYFTPELNR